MMKTPVAESKIESNLAQSVSKPEAWLEPPQAVIAAALLLTLVFFGLIRYRLRDMPLERDEGEYAYSGQLLLQGIPPYKFAYNMKLPGIYVAYAGIMAIFGETPAGIHLGLLLVNAAMAIVLYFLTTFLFGRMAGAVAAGSYALLSTSTSVMGFEAHATHFVVLPAIIGILILLRAVQQDRLSLLFASGVLLGIAVLMKQHGIFFVLFCLLQIFFSARDRHCSMRALAQRIAIYAAGVALPYAVTCALLYRAGVFQQFWFWTVSYAGEYSRMGLRRAIRALLSNSASVVAPAVPLWILAAIGLSAVFWNRSARQHRRLLALLLLCSFLSLCPGAYFRPHYFILLLPVVAILAGVGVISVAEHLSERSQRAFVPLLPLLIFLVCFGCSIASQRRTYFSLDSPAVLEATYSGSPFAAAPAVAEYVKSNSLPGDRIAVLGSEPEIYFYSQQRSATGYLYMYSLIVQHKYAPRMRAEFMHELETNHPKYLVYVDIWDSWGEREGAAQAVSFLQWMQNYMNEGYEQVGAAEVGPDGQYSWVDAANTDQHARHNLIYVLRQRPSAELR